MTGVCRGVFVIEVHREVKGMVCLSWRLGREG